MKIIKAWSIKVKHYQRRMCETVCPECGATVVRQYSNAKKQKHCGCKRKELRGESHHLYKHGKTPPVLYRKWQSINERCNNVNEKHYHRYGGRGISVCSLWGEYVPFREWAIENEWKPGQEIDRKDNDGNYSPDNCRFVTRTQNCQNKSNNKLTQENVTDIRRHLSLGHKGTEISRLFGVSPTMIYKIRDRIT